MSKRREWFFGAVVALPAGVAAGFLLQGALPARWVERLTPADTGGEEEEDAAPEVAPEEMEVSVTVAAASRADVPVTASAVGRVETLPAGRRSLTTRAAGLVSEVLVRESQTVAAGDILLRIDPAPLVAAVTSARAKAITATSQLDIFDRGGGERRLAELTAAGQKAEAALALARARAEHQRELAKQGLVAPIVMQEVEQALEEADRSVGLANAAVRTWQTAGAAAERATLVAEDVAAGDALVDVEAILAAAEVKAPAAGRLLAFTPRVGSSVEAGSLLGTLVCEDALAIRFDVGITDARRIAIGSLATIAGGVDSGARGRARVSIVASEVDERTGLVAVVADVESADPPLIAGEIVRGAIEVGCMKNACSIPEAAVVRNDDQTVAIVVDADGFAHVTAVTVLARGAGRCAVDGLEGFERVVIDGGYNLRDGARVVVR